MLVASVFVVPHFPIPSFPQQWFEAVTKSIILLL